jgi:hypothetical protein
MHVSRMYGHRHWRMQKQAPSCMGEDDNEMHAFKHALDLPPVKKRMHAKKM